MTITAEDVRYAALDMPMHGRLFRDLAWRGPRPGVLVFPEGFGVSEHTYRAAARIAELGYVALACDLYGEAFFSGGPTPEVRGRNEKIVAAPGGVRAVGESAFELLRARPEVDAGRIAAAGYCFGGTIGLELAFAGAPVAAVAALHPSFRGLSLADAGRARGRLELFIGAEDYAAPPEARAQFEAALAGQGVRWTMTVFGSVKHGFTNPDCAGMGDRVAYDAEADRRSWEAMAALFEETLAGP